MIKVYFESKSHSKLVAIFDTDELYNICLPSLEKEAENRQMKLTESVIEDVETHQLQPVTEKSQAIFWSTEDFEARAESNFNDLKVENPDEFVEFENWEQLYDKTKFPFELQQMIGAHDCNFGITWETVDTYIGNCEIRN